MVNSMVGRATSDMLIGPDWAMNIEICDICNHDPVQAKDVVKGIKKRLGSKNPKVQLLALTLLETIVKNCGDFVHMHVAERAVLNDMVKIVKKKPDFHVKEKILVLIDTWQEAFGGARARYPQYYAAYHELLRLGAVFPQKSERSAPVLTPPQTQPLSSYPHHLRNPENGNETTETSAEAEFPTLSLTEIQNARGIMDVLAEMLTAVDPERKEGLRQEVIVDLVEQCRTYKRRVVHLVNSTSDESLLCQGLALNDDLARVLAKHEALVTGTPVPSEKSKPETSRALVPIDAPLIDAEPRSATGGGAEADLLSLAPITTNGPSATPAKIEPKFDLLSGDDFNSPTAGNSLAIVAVGEAQPPATPVSQHNALALVDMFSQSNNVQNVSSSPQIQQPQNVPPAFYPNGNGGQRQPEPWSSHNQGSNPAWNGHMPQHQQQPSPGFGGPPSGGGLPPPPWEAQPGDNGTQSAQPYGGNMNMNMNMQQQQQVTGSHLPPMNHQPPPPVYTLQIPQQQFQFQGGMQQSQGGHMGYMYPQQMAQQMYTNQMGQVYGGGYGGYGGGGYGYGYGQQQNVQNIDGRMAGMSVSSVYSGPSMANASYVHVPKASKAEDKLFGDLVDFGKVKPKR